MPSSQRWAADLLDPTRHQKIQKVFHTVGFFGRLNHV
ncbi:MAG: hypothetical protein ACI8UO_005255 [Verrucomicrobiales bacterium]